jgi:hypothetical protein
MLIEIVGPDYQDYINAKSKRPDVKKLSTIAATPLSVLKSSPHLDSFRMNKVKNSVTLGIGL